MAHHFVVDGWLLAEIPVSDCLDNSLVCLPYPVNKVHPALPLVFALVIRLKA